MGMIGSFGRELDPDDLDEQDYFEWHGESFTVPGSVSALPIMRFAWSTVGSQNRTDRADAAARRAQSDEARAAANTEKVSAEMDMLAALHVFLRDTIGAHQWARFEELAVIHGDGIDEVMRVAQAIYSSVVDRPTTRPSDSSAGPSQSGSGSPGSYGSAEQTPGPMSPAAAQRAEINAALRPVGDAIRSSA